MSKFKVGDRAVCYSIAAGVERGTVSEVDGDTVVIDFDQPSADGTEQVEAHYKQCRKLRKKAKAPRRRIWVTEQTLLQLVDPHHVTCSAISNYKVIPPDVEFVEVRKKKGGARG